MKKKLLLGGMVLFIVSLVLMTVHEYTKPRSIPMPADDETVTIASEVIHGQGETNTYYQIEHGTPEAEKIRAILSKYTYRYSPKSLEQFCPFREVWLRKQGREYGLVPWYVKGEKSYFISVRGADFWI